MFNTSSTATDTRAYNNAKAAVVLRVTKTRADGRISKTLSKSTVWQPAASGDLDVVLWYRDGNTVYTLLPDGNKNTRQLKASAGTVVATYDYDPFGNVIVTTGTVLNPWKFSSEYHDSETGLVYYNYRDYAPSLGRWISRDPIEENGGMNLYLSGKNNLINYCDVNGMFWRKFFQGIAAASQIIAGVGMLLVPEPTAVTKIVGIVMFL